MMWVSSEIISDGQVTVILERFKSAMRFLVDRPEESSYIEIISCQAGSRSLLSNVKMKSTNQEIRKELRNQKSLSPIIRPSTRCI